MAKYTTVKSFIFKKWVLNNSNLGFPFIKNLRVTVYKGVAVPCMKLYTSFEDNCWQTLLLWKVSLSEKWVYEMKPIRWRWLVAKYTNVKRFAFRNVSIKLWNFRVFIYLKSRTAPTNDPILRDGMRCLSVEHDLRPICSISIF